MLCNLLYETAVFLSIAITTFEMAVQLNEKISARFFLKKKSSFNNEFIEFYISISHYNSNIYSD